jgi:pentapeptide MXKDX repeat protein
MKRSVMTGLLMACLSAAVAAQSAGTMDKGKASGSMHKMTDETTYTGCLEKGSAARTFVLTHASRADAMQHDSMKSESTKTPSMKDDAMKDDAMKKDAMAKETMNHDMMTSTVSLASSAVNLNKHVGHKVTVSGSADAMGKDATGMMSPTLTVKTLKMVAKSCS